MNVLLSQSSVQLAQVVKATGRNLWQVQGNHLMYYFDLRQDSWKNRTVALEVTLKEPSSWSFKTLWKRKLSLTMIKGFWKVVHPIRGSSGAKAKFVWFQGESSFQPLLGKAWYFIRSTSQFVKLPSRDNPDYLSKGRLSIIIF